MNYAPTTYVSAESLAEAIGSGRLSVAALATEAARFASVTVISDDDHAHARASLRHLLHHADETVRAAAVKGIAPHLDESCRATLADLAANDTSPHVRQVARETLEEDRPMAASVKDQLAALGIELTGDKKKHEIPAPIGMRVHITCIAEWDQFCRTLNYPKWHADLEPVVRAALNYGHGVTMVPTLTALDKARAAIEDQFATGWQESCPEVPAAIRARLHVLATAMLDFISSQRGQ